MRIFFIGTVEFSRKALEKLISLKAEVVGVATRESSAFNSDFADLTVLCKANNIPNKFIDNINSSESLEWIKSLKPDIAFCFGWSNLIKKDLLDIPPMGIIGFHPAALPQNKGRHPLIWALALGLKESATTFFFMDEGADSGDILSQKKFAIEDEDDAASIYVKMGDNALLQIEEFLPLLINKTYKKIKQDHAKGNTWRKRGAADGQIDFRMNSSTIFNLVRALTGPYVGAHLMYKQKEIKIWRTSIAKDTGNNIEPGKILSIEGNHIIVKTADSAIKIVEHGFTDLPKEGEYL